MTSLIAKGLKKTTVPASAGSLATIAGTGGAKLPVQILDFSQDVTGTISIPEANTYGYFKINMGSHSIDGAGASCFTNNNVFDVDLNGTGTINSNADLTINTSGTASTTNISSKGIDIAVTDNSTSYYEGWNSFITQNNSGFNGSQSGGNWNVIRENAGGTTGTWTATILDASTNLSGSCVGKSLTVKKNGTTVVNLNQATQGWGPISCVQGDVIVWNCTAGIGGGGTINRNQTWTFSGSPKIAYSSHTGNGGKSGTFITKSLVLTNNNANNLNLTLQSGTTSISSDTVVNGGSSQQLQGNSPTVSTSAWNLVAKFPDQTKAGVLYSAEPAFNGTNTTTDVAGVPTDGFDLSGFSGIFNRVT
mgnify:CR=1 FL=1